MAQSGEPGKHAVSTLLTSLITISRGDRVIRTFLKSEVCYFLLFLLNFCKTFASKAKLPLLLIEARVDNVFVEG